MTHALHYQSMTTITWQIAWQGHRMSMASMTTTWQEQLDKSIAKAWRNMATTQQQHGNTWL
jgi:hypothetical protein